jgi:flagellin-like protein
MQVSALLTEKRAVSSTIGVVLMVALTVILAAVVGAFAMGLFSQTTPPPPQTGFSVEYDVSGPTNTTNVTMTTGSEVRTSRLKVRIGGNTTWSRGSGQSGFTTSGWSTKKIESGDTLDIAEDGKPIQSGDKVQVIWETSKTSTVLNDWTIS